MLGQLALVVTHLLIRYKHDSDFASRLIPPHMEPCHCCIWSIPRYSAFGVRKHALQHRWRTMHIIRCPNGHSSTHSYPHFPTDRQWQWCHYRAMRARAPRQEDRLVDVDDHHRYTIRPILHGFRDQAHRCPMDLLDFRHHQLLPVLDVPCHRR